MNKITLKLLSIYLRQILSGQFERFKTSKDKNNKTKSNLRMISLIFLIIYGFGTLLVLWGMISYQLFSQLHALGDQKLMIQGKILDRFDLISLSMTFLTLIIGFLNFVFTFFYVSYFLNLTPSEEYLLTLPIDSKTLFASKIINISITSGFFFMIMNLVQFIMYGVIENVTFDYYFIFLIQSVIINLFCSILSIAISLFFVNIFKFLKNKDLITYLSILIFLPLVLGYNIVIQKITQNPSAIKDIFINLISNNFDKLKIIQIIFSPLFLFINYIINTIIKEKTILRFLHFLIQIGVVFLLYELVLIIFSPIYKKLLLMTNVKRAKINNNDSKTKSYINSSYKRRTPYISLLRKEISSIYREPQFFLNGPFVIILMPLILFVTYYFSYKNSNEMNGLISLILGNKNNMNLIVSIAVVASFLLGDFSSITSTAISREGKSFSILKTLPIKPKEYILSKITHGLILTFFGSLVFSFVLYFILKLNLYAVILICIIVLISSILFHIISISFDINKPKLNWDNPVIAMKQNFNAVYAIFVAMGYAVGLFFQTRFILKISFNFLLRLFPLLADKPDFTLILGLILIMFIVILENLIFYLLIISNLEKKYYEIEV